MQTMNNPVSLWGVHDGEENHAVGATSAVDALRLLEELWGAEMLDEYLAEPGVQVTLLTQDRAMQISHVEEDDLEAASATLWEEWISDPSRRYLGSSGPL